MRALIVGESGEEVEILCEALRLAGHEVVSSPESKPDIVVMHAQEYRRLHEALAEAKRKLEERKIVERAKGILMKSGGLAENEAYETLRRMAMDRGKRIGEIAQQLIDIAGALG